MEFGKIGQSYLFKIKQESHPSLQSCQSLGIRNQLLDQVLREKIKQLNWIHQLFVLLASSL